MKLLALEAMEEIKAAELAAEEMLAAARTQVKEDALAAEKLMQDKKQELQAHLQMSEKEHLAKAEAAAKAEIAVLATKNQEACNLLEGAAREKQPQAVQLIVEGVKQTLGSH